MEVEWTQLMCFDDLSTKSTKGLVFVQFQMYNDFATIVGHHPE
jgi:hypothetical protein